MADEPELTEEQAADMERQLAAHRARQERARQRAAYATTQPLRGLIADGTAQKMADAVAKVFSEIGEDTPLAANMRASANAIRIGLANLTAPVANMPDGAEPAPAPTA